jgi:hypothetical protein
MAYIPGETGTWDDNIAWDDADFWLEGLDPGSMTQPRGKGARGKKQQIYSQGPWAYR